MAESTGGGVSVGATCGVSRMSQSEDELLRDGDERRGGGVWSGGTSLDDMKMNQDKHFLMLSMLRIRCA